MSSHHPADVATPISQSSDGLLLIITAAAALAVVPEWTAASLTYPSYWGLSGFLLLAALLLLRPGRSWSPGSANRRLVVTFLVVVQMIYVAGWLRFGGSPVELGIQLGGLGLWWFLAAMGRRSDAALWIGCALHGLWDALHYGRVDFVPEWYGALCIVVDVAVGAFVLLRLKEASPSLEADA
jgi:hypothetical protein